MEKTSNPKFMMAMLYKNDSASAERRTSRLKCMPSQYSATVTGTSSTLTSGPAAMLHNTAPGLGGGLTYATPPSGQSMICSAVPPTWRQANEWPNSCMSTMPNSVRYSMTFQTADAYRF